MTTIRECCCCMRWRKLSCTYTQSQTLIGWSPNRIWLAYCAGVTLSSSSSSRAGISQSIELSPLPPIEDTRRIARHGSVGLPSDVQSSRRTVGGDKLLTTPVLSSDVSQCASNTWWLSCGSKLGILSVSLTAPAVIVWRWYTTHWRYELPSFYWIRSHSSTVSSFHLMWL